MQQIVIAGRLGADPEERVTPSGQKVWNLRVATNVRKGGEEVSMWWSVSVWGDSFDRMMPFFKKGSAIIVSGDFMPPRKYTDKNGEVQFALEITARNLSFSPFGKGTDGQSDNNNAGTNGFNQTQPQAQQRPQQAPAQAKSFSQPAGRPNEDRYANMGAQTDSGMGEDLGTTDDNLPF